MSLHDAWTALRHGGNLLSPPELDKLPEPETAHFTLADRLRAAWVDVAGDRPSAESVSAWLDAVLESACGLKSTWRKGPKVGASDAETLLDGTHFKPSRIWTGPDAEELVVFRSDADRLGVGRGRRPVARVVEYLRRRRTPLGIITNGRDWRLVWADTDSLAWVQWDADRWLAGDALSDELQVLRRVLSPAALHRGKAARGGLLEAIKATRGGQAKLSKELGERVRRSVETLLRSREQVIGDAWDEHASNDLYVAACHFVMRLVVTLFAEARELLPVDSPVYHQAYGLRGLLDQLDRLTPERRRSRHAAWPRLLALFRLLHQGSPHPVMTLPAYGGDLFRPGDKAGDGVQRALALLEALSDAPDDDVVHRILVLLTRTTQRVREGANWRTVAAPVDFTELTSEYIGILYEGLLDYELHRAGEQPVVFLNLGDQPALPLDRLEAMEDKALKDLVEKAKVKKSASEADEDDDSDDDEAPEDEDEGAEDEGDESSEVEDEDVADDARAEAHARALAWGRRAVEVAKLVKKPKGKKAEALAKYNSELDEGAKHLVAALKLPEELYLVRWGGTRKGAGTFYTRPQLTLPTVRRTLEPLIYEEAAESEAPRVRDPEALLALKVCDPAMGSGSFLVAALRILTEAVVESLHVHGRIEQAQGRTSIACELIPEGDRQLPTDGFEERLEAVVRRAVVEHCVYGVDNDPLAVELARVALWVETLDKRLPFTFLDHKLRCGDALVGTWLDRFRDYPLLCFDRKSPDEKYKGVNHPANVWKDALKEKRKEAIDQQVELITGQLRLNANTASDEELKAAVERVRRLYRELRAVPAGRPDERARIWRERIQTDEALVRVRDAFDTWCALWFWPLDRLDAMPLPSELPNPTEVALTEVKALRDELRFFHWELEFPDVFTEAGAGFDAVVGNPPWETLQPQSKEFFSNHDPLYRAYGKQEGLAVQNALFKAHAAIEDEWLAYKGYFKAITNWLNHAAEPYGDGKVAEHGGGDVSLVRGKQGAGLHKTWRGKRGRYRGLCDSAHPFRQQGTGKAYTYKMFVEQAHALLRSGGQVGIVVPSGLYTDKGTGDLRRLLLGQCKWRWLYGFENRDKIFDIHRSFKFCVLIAEKGGTTVAIQAAFMRHQLEDWADATAVLDYPAERVQTFSPKSLSILEIRSEKDLEVLTKLYSNGVLLGDDGPCGWGIKYAQGDFNMTSDSKLFIAREKAEAQGFKPDIYGRWVNDNEEVLLPLYQGAMIHQHDPFFKGWSPNEEGKIGWNLIEWQEKAWLPKYLVAYENYASSTKANRGLKVGFRDIARSTDERTSIAALVPDLPCGNVVGVFSVGREDPTALAAVMGSFAFDFAARVRISGTHMNYYVVEELPLPEPESAESLAEVAFRLDLGHERFAQWAMRRQRLPWRALWARTRHERLRLQCMLDAIGAVLYGLDYGDLAWILRDCDHPAGRLSDKAFCRLLDAKGFWRVGKTEPPELRQTILSLAAFENLEAAIHAAGADRDAGIQAFCNQNDGDGWMLPETLCIAELGLTRTVDVGVYDERARTPQPVRAQMGPRFLDWQLSQTPEESWAECERHTRALRSHGSTSAPPDAAPVGPRDLVQQNLFGGD